MPSSPPSSAPKTPRTSQAPAPTVFYEAHNYRPEESVGNLMRQILGALADNIELHLAHTDLTNAQWMPLYKVFSGQASSVAELARQCHLDTGAMTRMLDRLEAKGLCQRVRSDTDRRVVNIALTDAGKQAAQDIPRVLSGVQNTHLAGFNAQEFETLKGFLRRILANAQTPAAQPTPTLSSHFSSEQDPGATDAL
jgi:DNA-binding MarR family transcriptional regulator